MKAHIGDRIVVRGPRVGDPTRVAIVTALRHDDGTPPYVVRWLDNGREALIFPGPDARVEPPTAAGGRHGRGEQASRPR